MRVFVTGATGFIGSAIVSELLGVGHQVVGLARSDASGASLKAVGAEVHRGALDDLDSLKRGAEASDGAIHAAFVHDFLSNNSVHDFSALYLAAAETDRRAIETLGMALAGSDRPLVVTSGTALLAPNRLGTEDDGPDPAASAAPRIASEETTLSMASRSVRSSVVRLPPSVHGDGDRGFVLGLINFARERAVSGYVDEGLNRWPAVHRLDAAVLYRLALESAPAGSRLHAVAEEGVPLRDIASAIGRHLNVPVVSVPSEGAGDHFGWLANFIAMDNPTSSSLTRKRVGWRPAQRNLIQDLEQGSYFDSLKS
jgi:nucleoside-diphosphate-sugar epimerase